MNNNASFDFDAIRNMTVDKLMLKAQVYVRKYLSKSDSIRLIKAYNNGDFEEVKRILNATQKVMNNNLRSLDLIVAQTFLKQALEKTKDEDSDKRRRRKKMDGLSSGAIAFIVIGIAVLVVAALIGVAYLKSKNKTVGDVLTRNSIEGKNIKNQISYTEKDRAMLELIHELAEVYRTTDEYIKS